MSKLIGCTVQPENISGVIQLENGKVVNKVIDKSNQFFNTVVQAIKGKDEETVIKYLLGYTPIQDVYAAEGHGEAVTIEYGVVKFAGMELNNALTQRMLRMLKEGFDIEPMRLFLENLMLNPSLTAVEELYLFLEANQLSLTTDGHFLAYKSVNADFTSIHDGKTGNDIGVPVKMPRNMVDDNRNKTCSKGLHFASLDYCKNHFQGDQIIALKINPKDVVSIPSDYNNQKGRACEYLPIAVVTDEVKVQGRDPLSEAAVVDVGGFGARIYHDEPNIEEVERVLDVSWDNQKTLAENLRSKAEQQIRDNKGRFTKKA